MFIPLSLGYFLLSFSPFIPQRSQGQTGESTAERVHEGIFLAL